MNTYTVKTRAQIRKTLATMVPSQVVFIHERDYKVFKNEYHNNYRTRVFTTLRTPCGNFRGVMKLRKGVRL